MSEKLGTAVSAIVVLLVAVVGGVFALATTLFLGFRWIAGQPLAFANPTIMAGYSVALFGAGVVLGWAISMGSGLQDAIGDMAAAMGAAIGSDRGRGRLADRRTVAEISKLEAEADSIRPPALFPVSRANGGNEWT